MGLLLAFSPFIAFFIVERLAGPTAGLTAGAVTSAALLARDWLRGRRPPKILEVGTLLLFGALALWAATEGAQDWTVAGVRLRVDAGLLLIVLASLALRRPFTLQYAREEASAEVAASPAFLAVNTVITAAWALAFVVMVAADLLLILRPETRPWIAIAATVAALTGAFKFTAWYPDQAAQRLDYGPEARPHS